MDSVAVKIDQLLRGGKMSKYQSFSKIYEDQHIYDTGVVEFFSAIMYLDGKSTFNFLRGAMFYSQGRML